MIETMQLYVLHHVLQLINRFRRDEQGASLAEYGLLIALIAVVCIAVITTLGKNISTMFASLAAAI